ncbi:MAG: glycosyltransferase family 39 protein [Pseudomonadota bacterium]|nr:glycosyltransferase family 39 protein [Pseudomonadota bacterium]
MTSVALGSRRALRAPHLSPVGAVWVSCGVVVLWALWAAYFNSAQFGDNIEQFNWAQSLELGYHKHPPLPSWVLGTVIKVFGPSIYWAYVLATVCLVGSALFTWLIGRELVGERVAAAGVVLWGLNMTFSQRVQLYNHNTVLVLWLAATVWLAMRASRPGRRSALWWCGAGLAAGAAVLSKYQALVPLAGLILALFGAGRLRQPAQRGGLLLAGILMAALCAPHVVWVTRHDFSTLRYASDAVEKSDLLERGGFLLSFAANQVRLWFPALLAMALCLGWERWVSPRGRPAPRPMALRADAVRLRPWMIGLVWWGLAILVVMALGAGVSLRNHWGVQALQFFSLWLAWRWERRRPIELTHLVVAALLVHGLSLGWYALEHEDPTAVLTPKRLDTMYPARRLARTAVAHWSEKTDCPLRYVAGTVFDAGLVSLYSGGSLEVFDTESATPWVHPEDLHRRGALYVLDQGDAVPPGVTDVVTFNLVPPSRARGLSPKIIKLGILRPTGPCY